MKSPIQRLICRQDPEDERLTLLGLFQSPTLRACLAFRHLPPNSARTGYATQGAFDLYLRAAVHRRGQRPPKGLGSNKTVEAT